MKGTFPVNKFRELETPFYYYDVNVLRETLSCINKEAGKYNNFCVHYAVKANANHKILTIIRENGLGADCVSGGEIRAAVKAGFPTNKITGKFFIVQKPVVSQPVNCRHDFAFGIIAFIQSVFNLAHRSRFRRQEIQGFIVC